MGFLRVVSFPGSSEMPHAFLDLFPKIRAGLGRGLCLVGWLPAGPLLSGCVFLGAWGWEETPGSNFYRVVSLGMDFKLKKTSDILVYCTPPYGRKDGSFPYCSSDILAYQLTGPSP